MNDIKEKLFEVESQTNELSPADKKIKKQLNATQKQIKNLQKRISLFEENRKQYAHLMLDLVKKRQINVHHTKRKLRTVPWTTGYERTLEQIKIEAEKQNKKNKTR